jgi:hypothetical protein
MSAEKNKILERDLDKRKYRAMTFCNPNLAKEFSPQCVIIWKSIKKSERHFKKMLIEKKIHMK